MLQHVKSTESWNEKSLGAKGFTLIELLVVIVILGILAAVVVFAVGGITNKGQEEACKTEARTVRTAEEAKFAQNNIYASASDLVTDKFLSNAPKLVKVDPDTSYTGATPGYKLSWDTSTTPGAKCAAITPAINP